MDGENPMRAIRIEKVTVNIGAGEAGPKLESSKKILERITGRAVFITRTRRRTTFGTPKKRPIGVKVTLRGKAAKDLLKKLLQAVDLKLKRDQFDSTGNFSFGISEYINIPGIRYDPEVGILGMDVCVTLERPGFRIKRRMIRPKRIGRPHRIAKEEAAEWAKKELGIEVI